MRRLVPPAPHSPAHRPAAARGLAAPPGGGAHASRGLRLAAPHGRRGSRAAGAPHSFSKGGKRRTTPKICRLTKAARCAILHLDGRRKFALRRPGIGAYAEISRAFRCVYREFTPNGAQISGCHAFCTEFCRCFRPVSARTRILPPGPASRRNCVPPIAKGDRRPHVRLRRGRAELHKIKGLSDKWKHSTT